MQKPNKISVTTYILLAITAILFVLAISFILMGICNHDYPTPYRVLLLKQSLILMAGSLISLLIADRLIFNTTQVRVYQPDL